MSRYFIESLKIDKLWGYRNIDLTFNNDVNVLIGPNASGKTTILNLLHSILSLDLPILLNFNFNQAEIQLRRFTGRAIRTITVRFDATESILELSIGKKKFSLNINAISGREFLGHYWDETGTVVPRTIPPHLKQKIVPEELYDDPHGDFRY